MKNVYLISCTAKKQKKRCKVVEMYEPSILFKSSLDYALNQVDDKESQIYILSAKYGLLSLNEEIETYDVTLKKMKKNEREKWAKKVLEQMENIFDMQNVYFIFLAGEAYIKPLTQYLKDGMYRNPIPKKYRIYGKRVKWLKENKK